MDNKKFEQLIDLIINENEEQARALFHDIVVEKSREIYESMMDEDDMMNQPSGMVEDLLDEIGSEEQGMAEGEDEEFDISDMDDDGDETVDIDMDDEEGDEEGLEDRVVDLEDKLDQLMAEFEEIMGDKDHMEPDADNMGGPSDNDADNMDDEMDDDMDEAMMEAITLKKVPVTHGDNGAYTTSPGLKNSGQAGMDSKPVKFSGASEAVPTGPKGPTNAYAKGETSVKGAGSFKNSPAQNNFSEKGESTPKPVTKDEAGKVRSPVAESRKAPAKRRI
jgi:hypothetical protein